MAPVLPEADFEMHPGNEVTVKYQQPNLQSWVL